MKSGLVKVQVGEDSVRIARLLRDFFTHCQDRAMDFLGDFCAVLID